MSAPIRTPDKANPSRRSDPQGLPPLESPATPNFVHLKVHSAYSLLEGALQIPIIAKLAEAHAMPAVGLTDTSNLYGALEFSDKLAGAGIQPIIGCTLGVDFRDAPRPRTELAPGRNEAASKPAGPVALIAASEAGYARLMKLASAAHLEPSDVEPPHIKIDHLDGRGAEGVIALTGGPDGPIDTALRDGQSDLALARLTMLQKAFGTRLYVELQRHGLKSEHDVEPQLLELAYALGLPIVATNEVYFASPDDYDAHDALLCIAEGRYVVEDNRRRVTREHYFKSAAEMAELFADLPEALANTIEIAKLCAYRPKGKKPILPRFVATKMGASESEQVAAEEQELRRQAEAGLTARLGANAMAPGFSRADYDKRLAFEIDVIAKMKFPGYFLIVADFIQWPRRKAFPSDPAAARVPARSSPGR